MIKISKFCQNCGAPLIPDGKFCESCGTPIEQPQAPPTYTQPQQPVYTQPPPVYAQPQINVNINNPNLAVSPKSQGVLIILWFFGGFFGLHYFYAGRIGMGLLYLCTVGIFGLGWIVDICAILGGTFRDEHGRPISN